MIMVPDPQSYVKFAANQPLFDLQTAWIAQNIKRLNIKAALFTGDMVEHNNKVIADGLPSKNNGDQTGKQQWEAVSRALARLDHRIPYVVAQGNHDAGYLSSEHRGSLAPQYIYPERNITFEQSLVSTCANAAGVHSMENSAYEFTNEHWGKILIITFEFAPRDEVLQWAKTLTESRRFQKHRVFILTHSFLETGNNRIVRENYKLTPRNWPQEIWDKLIYPSRNICMVLCGHAGTPPRIAPGDRAKDVDYRCTQALRTDLAADGHPVVQMMFNSQNGDGDWSGNGGDCWLRILEFHPDGHTIGVRTFSPLFALSRLTADMAWRTASYDQYEIIIK